MCEENNNTNELECNCLNELFKKIIKLQKQDSNICNDGGCDRPFLGPTTNLPCYNTRPVSLYNCTTGNLWEIDYTFNGNNGRSTVFRCESIDECCLTCRILIDNGNNNYTPTNNFFTININCISAVTCHQDVSLNI